MRALQTTLNDLAAALDEACNARPKALHRLRPTVPTPDEIEAAEITRRAAEVRDRLPLARLTMAERIEAQERAEDHFEELEAEFGPLSRDADFDERWPPEEDR